MCRHYSRWLLRLKKIWDALLNQNYSNVSCLCVYCRLLIHKTLSNSSLGRLFSTSRLRYGINNLISLKLWWKLETACSVQNNNRSLIIYWSQQVLKGVVRCMKLKNIESIIFKIHLMQIFSSLVRQS